MKPWKALGIDGFQTGFFHTRWKIVGEALCKTVIDFLKQRDLDKNFNRTMIYLISKVEVPKTINQLRPIDLCSVVYKIIPKVIVNKLKPVMPPTQTSFIPRRHIIENIIIAQEVICSMRSKEGKLASWL